MFNWSTVTENPFRFSSDNINTVDIPDVKYEVFLKMIQFMYCGSLKKSEITPEDAIPLYFAQNQYLLDSTLSLEVIKENISENNVMDILALGIQFSYPEISEICNAYLVSNIELVYLKVRDAFREAKNNGTLDTDPMYQFLSESNFIWELIVTNENLHYHTQWAYRLLGFSSEYTGWPATNVSKCSTIFS